ncbi:MAG: hypothetical protein JWM46_125 [Candidatus Kaiserbacteria bacterium]|nr:hypothetical protein [Candidatus Kaiserbacteria bacterium]
MTRKCVVLVTIMLLMSVGAHARNITVGRCTVEVDDRFDVAAPMTYSAAAHICGLAWDKTPLPKHEPLSNGSEASPVSDSELEHPEEPDPDAKSLPFAPQVVKPLESKYRVPWLYDTESILNK